MPKPDREHLATFTGAAYALHFWHGQSRDDLVAAMDAALRDTDTYESPGAPQLSLPRPQAQTVLRALALYEQALLLVVPQGADTAELARVYEAREGCSELLSRPGRATGKSAQQPTPTAVVDQDAIGRPGR